MNDADIWLELDAIFVLPQRQVGDIDINQMMKRYGISESGAHSRMAQLVRTGDWEYITVSDNTSAQGRRKVIRRVYNDDTEGE